MPSDREFARERFQIVKARLEDDRAEIERLDRVQLEREYRLLGKVLYDLQEGQVLVALQQWRSYFGRELARHRAEHRAQQEAFDNWLRQPLEKRNRTPRPKPPSLGVQVTSQDGQVYVIDDRYLAMMDDLIMRLERWQSSDDN